MLLFSVRLHLTGNFWKQDACWPEKNLAAVAENFRLDGEGDILWSCGDFIQISLRRFHLPLPHSPHNGPEIWELGKGQGWDAIA